MTRDPDATDLAIHSLIGAWAIKHRVLMTAAALEELEMELLRPVFVGRNAAMRACEAIATDEATDPCHYDHHGLCQAHALQPKGECYGTGPRRPCP